MTTATEVIYDGDCGICNACIRGLQRRDGAQRLRCTPSSACTWDDAALQPFATTVVVRTSDGRTVTASTAVATALSQLPGFWGLLGRWVCFLNRSRALTAYHDRWYYAVAKRRSRISNALVALRVLDQSCRVPTR